MRLDDLPPATSVFIGANIFIYHFTGASEERTRLLQRWRQGNWPALPPSASSSRSCTA